MSIGRRYINVSVLKLLAVAGLGSFQLTRLFQQVRQAVVRRSSYVPNHKDRRFQVGREPANQLFEGLEATG